MVEDARREMSDLVQLGEVAAEGAKQIALLYHNAREKGIHLTDESNAILRQSFDQWFDYGIR